MNLNLLIEETMKSKYDASIYPKIYKEIIKEFLDYATPNLVLNKDYTSNYLHSKIYLSPNSKNFYTNGGNYTVLGFDELDKLAKNKYDIDFEKIQKNHARYTTLNIIGYGGFMSNMIYFITEKHKRSNFKNETIFNTINVFENDKFSLINNIRTFQDTSLIRDKYKLGSKLALLYNLEQSSNIFGYINLKERYFTKIDIENENPHHDHIYIGSPDFETRKILKNECFLFFGNSNSDFIIEKSPNTDIMVRETYGKINIIEFWVGILESMYEFCRILERYNSKQLSEIRNDTTMFSLNVQKDFNEHYSYVKEREKSEAIAKDEVLNFVGIINNTMAANYTIATDITTINTQNEDEDEDEIDF